MAIVTQHITIIYSTCFQMELSFKTSRNMWWKTKVLDDSKRSLFAVRDKHIRVAHIVSSRTYVLSSWIIESIKSHPMNECLYDVRLQRPPTRLVQQERIIDMWARTIINSRPGKEQTNIFGRIFKLTIINVDMFPSSPLNIFFPIDYVRFGRFFYIFENNKQPNKS